MAITERPTAQDMVDRYVAAELSVLDGKETIFNGRKLVLSDLKEIRDGRLEWERRVSVQKSQAGGRPGYAFAEFR